MDPVETDIPQETGTDDLRSELESAYAAQEVPIAEDSAPSRDRDEFGRFAKKQILEPKSETVATEAIQPIVLPKSWAADQAERWSQLPRELQQYLANRESERERFLGQRSDKAARYERQWEPLERELANYSHILGQNPRESLVNLVRAQAAMDANPLQAIAFMCQTYGINPAQLSTQQQAAPQQQQYDPRYNSIEQKFQRFEQYMEEQRQAQLNQHMEGLNNEIIAFEQEKDASGNLLRPHFAAVRQAMSPYAALFSKLEPDATPKQILDKSYRHAVADNPEIAKLDQQLAEQKRLNDLQTQANKARKAGAPLSSLGNSSNTISRVSADDLRGQIEAAWDIHS